MCREPNKRSVKHGITFLRFFSNFITEQLFLRRIVLAAGKYPRLHSESFYLRREEASSLKYVYCSGKADVILPITCP